METLGARIRAYRRLSDVAGYALARRIGRSAGWLSLVEHDYLSPSADVLVRIAVALDVPVRILLADAEERQ